MLIADLSPGLILILGALLIPFLPGRARVIWMVILPVIGFWQAMKMAGAAEGFRHRPRFHTAGVFQSSKSEIGFAFQEDLLRLPSHAYGQQPV